MSLRIGCPGCRESMSVDDHLIGQQVHCPKCGQGLVVPIPVRQTAKKKLGGNCPRCRKALAPGTQVCPHCLTTVATGKRLKLLQRWARRPMRTAVGLSVMVILVVAGGYFAWMQRELWESPAAPSSDAVNQVTSKDLSTGAAEAWADKLFAAKARPDLLAAVSELEHLGHTAVAPVGDRLRAVVGRPLRSVSSARAAVALIGAGGDTLWLPLLRQAADIQPLHWDAQCARARLGDTDVLDDLVGQWRAQLEALLFFERMEADMRAAGEPFEPGVVEHARAHMQALAGALRALTARDPQAVLERVLGGYWDSWRWLGTQRGAGFASAAFEMALPEKGRASEPERVRSARRLLDQTAQQGSLATRAGAGLVLAQNAPQYESLRTRIVAAIAAELPKASPVDQQRGAWTMARLADQRWGAFDAGRHPLEATAADVQAAMQWAAAAGLTPADPAAPLRRLTPAPQLERRIVSVKAQWTRDLLRQLRGDWRTSNAARHEWHDARLADSAALLSLLRDGGEAERPALANGLALIADANLTAARPQLEIWRVAVDQPPWVRTLANWTLAALDFRAARPPSGWTPVLPRDVTADFQSPGPGWEHFSAVLAGGGPRMLAVVKESKQLTDADKQRLLESAARTNE